MLDLLQPETVKGIIMIFLIIWFVSGAGFRVIARLIRRFLEGK